MDMNIYPTSLPLLLLLLLPVVVLIGSALLLLHRKQTAHNYNFPPGSEGWPFVGETLQMISANKTEDPMSFVDERVRCYGRVFTTHLFGERTVYSTDPEFNQLVMNGEGRFFETSYPPSFTTLVGSSSIANLRGHVHKRMHSLTINRFSSSAVMLQLLPEMDRLVRRTLDSWQEGRAVRLQALVKKMNFEHFVKQITGEGPGERTEALRKEYLSFVDGFFAIPLPLPSFLSSFSRHGRAVRAGGKVREEMLRVVTERSGCGRKEATDVLDEVMVADEAFGEEERLGGARIAEFLVSLLAAGYDNTSTVMTAAVKFLTDNPRALAEIREEHEQILRAKKKQDDSLEWSDYMAMPFTQCVINETLRMTNVAIGPWRRAVTDVQFKGYTIPKGCKVLASTQAVHLDHENFKDARTFNPWRWQGGGKNDIAANLLAPFGGGSRLCPGLKLAQLQISVFIHHFVTRFLWEVAEKDKLVFFPTARTLKGYPIILSRVHREMFCY